MIPFNEIFKFVVDTCAQHNIDDSHGLKHSMDVLNYSQKIFNKEKVLNNIVFDYPYEKIIYTSAILHDMCDNKYMDDDDGLYNIKKFLKKDLDYKENEIDVIGKIINTMSYSKVKKYGFPDLQEYQLPYNIVREADLLAAYDIDRCIAYGVNKRNMTYTESFCEARKLYNIRMGKHIEDNLFTTNFALEEGKVLDVINRKRIAEIEYVLKI